MSEISRRTFTAALAAGAGFAAQQSASPGSPNIVFICADEHGGPFLGPQGHPIVKTPHLDRLAAAGVLFRNAYCGSPVCVPGRAGMMSGMFPSDVGSFCNSTPFKHPVPTWGNRLRGAGYSCWATGKLDLTPGTDYGFHEAGTDHRRSGTPDITSLFRAPMCYRATMRNQVNGSFKKIEGHDQKVFENALHFLQNEAGRAGKPWAMIVLLVGASAQWVTGFLVDWLHRSRYRARSRSIPAITGFVLSAAGLAALRLTSSAHAGVLCFGLATFGAEMTVSPSWAFCIDLGKGRSGSVSGAMNMVGNLGSFVSASLFPWMYKLTGDSMSYFLLAGALNLLAAAMWLAMKSSKPVMLLEKPCEA